MTSDKKRKCEDNPHKSESTLKEEYVADLDTYREKAMTIPIPSRLTLCADR